MGLDGQAREGLLELTRYLSDVEGFAQNSNEYVGNNAANFV